MFCLFLSTILILDKLQGDQEQSRQTCEVNNTLIIIMVLSSNLESQSQF